MHHTHRSIPSAQSGRLIQGYVSFTPSTLNVNECSLREVVQVSCSNAVNIELFVPAFFKLSYVLVLADDVISPNHLQSQTVKKHGSCSRCGFCWFLPSFLQEIQFLATQQLVFELNPAVFSIRMKIQGSSVKCLILPNGLQRLNFQRIWPKFSIQEELIET